MPTESEILEVAPGILKLENPYCRASEVTVDQFGPHFKTMPQNASRKNLVNDCLKTCIANHYGHSLWKK